MNSDRLVGLAILLVLALICMGVGIAVAGNETPLLILSIVFSIAGCLVMLVVGLALLFEWK